VSTEETVELEIMPLEQQHRFATPLHSRGGRSERECGLSASPGRDIEDLAPRAQAFKDACTRRALLELSIEADMAELRATSINQSRRPRKSRPIDPRKIFIAKFKAEKKNYSGKGICFELDKAGVLPLARWTKVIGSRLWVELWDCKDTTIRHCVRNFVNGIAPFSAKQPDSGRHSDVLPKGA
jgi:hypothetical protein